MASLVGRSGSVYHAYGASRNADADVLAEVEELIAQYGIRGLIAACRNSSAGEQFEKLGGNGALRTAQLILRRIIAVKNPRLEAEVMALGTGLFVEDKATMGKIAGKYGISKQALSKRVVKFCDENDLPPSCYMRSKKDRRTYALTNQPRSAPT